MKSEILDEINLKVLKHLKQVMPQFGDAIDAKFKLYENRHYSKVLELNSRSMLLQEEVQQVKLDNKRITKQVLSAK